MSNRQTVSWPIDWDDPHLTLSLTPDLKRLVVGNWDIYWFRHPGLAHATVYPHGSSSLDRKQPTAKFADPLELKCWLIAKGLLNV